MEATLTERTTVLYEHLYSICCLRLTFINWYVQVNGRIINHEVYVDLDCRCRASNER
jgi:hypothetical protein